MRQITVLASPHNNLIAAITEALAGAHINIDSITGENYGSQSVVIITVSDEPATLRALQNRPEWRVISEDAVLVRVKDEVGALARLARRFADKGIIIRSIRFVERYEGHALVAVATGCPAQAREAVKDLIAT